MIVKSRLSCYSNYPLQRFPEKRESKQTPQNLWMNGVRTDLIQNETSVCVVFVMTTYKHSCMFGVRNDYKQQLLYMWCSY